MHHLFIGLVDHECDVDGDIIRLSTTDLERLLGWLETVMDVRQFDARRVLEEVELIQEMRSRFIKAIAAAGEGMS